MKKTKKDILYAPIGTKARVFDSGKVEFIEAKDIYGNIETRQKKFKNRKDAILTLLNAGYFYKKK